MGQRTAIIVKVETKKKVIATRGYHLQWGYGKMMPMYLIGYLSRLYSADSYFRHVDENNKSKSLDKFFEKTYLMDDTFSANYHYKVAKDEPLGKINSYVGFPKIEDVKECFDKQFDNNNGAMIVRVKIKDEAYKKIGSFDALESIDIAYVEGEEDNHDGYAKKFLTSKEWFDIPINKEAKENEAFQKAYNGMLELWGLSEYAESNKE